MEENTKEVSLERAHKHFIYNKDDLQGTHIEQSLLSNTMDRYDVSICTIKTDSLNVS